MKRSHLIALIVIAVIVFGIIFVIKNFSVITVTFNSDVSSVTILSKSGDKTAVINKSGDKTVLTNGDYSLVPRGDKVSEDKIPITVNKIEGFDVNPPYSAEYLTSVADKSQPGIEAAFDKQFPNVINDYTIQSTTAYLKGEWIGGVLVDKRSTYNDLYDFYRFVARYETDHWQIINTPDLVLTKNNFPDVPDSVLNSINTLEQIVY
ncbi:MAG: hypothetical protein ABI303_03220 [Candidatus Saccharimonas sp.]